MTVVNGTVTDLDGLCEKHASRYRVVAAMIEITTKLPSMITAWLRIGLVLEARARM